MNVQFLTTLLQAQPGGSPAFTFILMGGMIAVMYFFMIRPQAKRAKEQKKFAESMTTGEQIVTSSGIHGRITRDNQDGTLQIEISRNTFMIIERSAISMELTNAQRKKSPAQVVEAPANPAK